MLVVTQASSTRSAVLFAKPSRLAIKGRAKVSSVFFFCSKGLSLRPDAHLSQRVPARLRCRAHDERTAGGLLYDHGAHSLARHPSMGSFTEGLSGQKGAGGGRLSPFGIGKSLLGFRDNTRALVKRAREVLVV